MFGIGTLPNNIRFPSPECYTTFWRMTIYSDTLHWLDITPIFDPLLIWTLLPNLTFYLIVWGFHRTFAAGAVCQQRTLTPPDTWSCPTLELAYVLMSRPISHELVLFPDFCDSNIPRYFCFALSVYLVHKLISLYVNCDLDLWSPTSKINRVHSFIMINISAKFDEEAHNGVVCIVFTRYTQGHMDSRTDAALLYPPETRGPGITKWDGKSGPNKQQKQMSDLKKTNKKRIWSRHQHFIIHTEHIPTHLYQGKTNLGYAGSYNGSTVDHWSLFSNEKSCKV